MSTKINVRSPYYIKESNASLSYAVLELYVYSGEDKPLSSQYTIKKYEIDSNNYVVFEISQLVRDYLIPLSVENNLTTSVWVEADIELFDSSDVSLGTSNYDYIAFDGYGYFEEGVNPELSRTILQSNDIIYRYINDEFGVVVFSEDVTNVSFYNNGVLLSETSITDDTDSLTKGRYIEANGVGGLQSFKNRVSQSGGTFIDSICLQQFYKSNNIKDVDKIYVTSSSGVDVLNVVNISECKYNPIKVRFYNKFGVIQDIWFFKKSTVKTSIKKEKYKRNTLIQSSIVYSTEDHQSVDYNLVANESVVMNTGFVHEQYSEVIRQLLLSENVWAYIDDKYLPVSVSSNSIDYKTSLNDKLINYTMNFDFAFNKINDVT